MPRPMLRSRLARSRVTAAVTAFVTVAATLALVAGTAVPAQAATRVGVTDPAGDVMSLDGTLLTNRERTVDVRWATIATARSFDGAIRMRVKVQDLRPRLPQLAFVGLLRGDDRHQVIARLSADRVSVDGPDQDNELDRVCRPSSVSVDRRRDVATLLVAKSCLGRGRSVTVEDAATIYSRNARRESFQAFDRIEAAAGAVLAYPR